MSNHFVAAKPRYRVTVQFYGEAEVEVEAGEGYEKIQDFDEAFGDKAFGGAEHWWFTMHDATVERA